MAGANFWIKRILAEAEQDSNSLARRGRIYQIGETFTLQGLASVFFVLETDSADIEFEFYDIVSDTTTVTATLYEAPTVGAATSTITPRNLNRNYPDASTTLLYSTATMTGGVKVGSELVGTSSKAGGSISQSKLFALKPATKYGMAFVNQANQVTLMHLNLGWSEGAPDATRLWDTTTSQPD